MSRKQRKIEKELRARKAAEEKIAREEKEKEQRKQRAEAEKKRRAALTPEERKKEDKSTAIGCGIILLILLVVGGCSAGMLNRDKDTEGEKTPTTTTTAVEEDTIEADSQDAENWLKESFGVESWTEILMEDPSLWPGYINGTEVKAGMWHIRLQVDRKADADMGKQAAKAVANLIRLSNHDPRIAGIHWVIIEDGAGVFIAQESV